MTVPPIPTSPYGPWIHLELRCPYCARPNHDHARTPGEVPATDGSSLSICWGCHQVAVFDSVNGQLVLRLPSETERADIETDPEVKAMLGAMTEAHRPTEARELMGWGKR